MTEACVNQVLVGQRAPDFCANMVDRNGHIEEGVRFSEAAKGRYALVFFYPLDFTFVCPSELIALDHRMKAFEALGVEVFAVSIDSAFAHVAWRERAVNDGGIGPVQYRMVADVDHSICKAFGVEHPEAHVAMRGAFVIDKEGVVQSQVINNLPLGRNLDELVRTFEALQFFEQHGEVCPAGWKQGDAGMKPTAEGVASYLSEHQESL